MTTPLRQSLAEKYPDAMLISDSRFDSCIIGVGYSTISQSSITVYDTSKVIEILILDGMTYEEAVEYFDFNIANAYHGTATPLFINTVADILQ